MGALGEQRFDVVYTGIGALGWLPDLDGWAEVVYELLRPGGVLYLVEVHPMWVALNEDGTTLGEDAIDSTYRLWKADRQGPYAAPDAVFNNTTTYERLHSISAVLSAVLAAGLHIELFHEYDVTPAPTPWLQRGSDGLYRFGAGQHRFPVTYSLGARRPA